MVVETVDYQPNEMGLFPAPTTPDEVGARMLIQERIDTEQAAEDAKKVMAARREADAANDVEMQLSDEEAGAEVNSWNTGAKRQVLSARASFCSPFTRIWRRRLTRR